MSLDYAGVVRYAQTHPTHDGDTWDGWCAAFMVDAGDFAHAFPTAHDAFLHSHVYSPSRLPIAAVPTGWLLWWDYVASDGTNYGHVGYAAPGSLALMASGFVTRPIHPDLGYVDRASYARTTGHRYLGASPDFGGQYLRGVQPVRASTARTYTVRDGDTLTAIAGRFRTTWQKLYAANRAVIGADPNTIHAPQKLVIP